MHIPVKKHDEKTDGRVCRKKVSLKGEIYGILYVKLGVAFGDPLRRLVDR